jgi:Flp pilus assembly protein TadG
MSKPLEEGAAQAAFQTRIQMARAEQAAANAVTTAQTTVAQRQSEHQQAIAARTAAVQRLTETLGGSNG